MDSATTTRVSAVEEQLGLMVRSFKQFWIRAAADLHPQIQPLGYGVLVLLTKGGPQPMASVADRMAVEAAMAFVDVIRMGELDRLRVCAAEDCSDVVVDLSKNRSRRFCDSGCGNRANVAAYRARLATGQR